MRRMTLANRCSGILNERKTRSSQLSGSKTLLRTLASITGRIRIITMLIMLKADSQK